MKKEKTMVKKLRIDKETLLPLGPRQMDEVAGGTVITRYVHRDGPVDTSVVHL